MPVWINRAWVCRVFLLPALLCSWAVSEPAPDGPGRAEAGRDSLPGFTLEDALAQGVDGHPGLKAFALRIEAARAREAQAGAYPNPEAGVDLENLLGNKGYSGTGGLETTVRIGQPIPLGGKRAMASALAADERHLAELESQAALERVRTRIRMAFLAGLHAQARMSLAEENLRLDSAFVDVALARRAAGKASVLEEGKARMLLAQGRLGRERSRRERVAAWRNLAAEMGKGDMPMRFLAGGLDSVALPARDEYRKRWEDHPARLRFPQEGRIRRAELSLRKAERIPDLRLDAGLRHSDEADANGFVFGVSMPLPIWNRNAGGIREAESFVSLSQVDSAAEALRRNARFEELYAAIEGAAEEVRTLEERVLPEGEKTFSEAREGRAAGRFSYLEVIDAQKALFDAKAQYLDALVAFHKARIALEGGPDGAFGSEASAMENPPSPPQPSGASHE